MIWGFYYVSKELLAKMKQSAIDTATGKRITVPGDMTYKEWYKQYVKESMKSSKNNSGNVANSSGSDIIEMKKIKAVDTAGNRNEIPLTEVQIQENIDYAVFLGMPREHIRYGDHYNTSYGSVFDMLYIGTDVYPGNHKQTANQRISNKGAIAHEVVGHYETVHKGTDQKDLLLDEVQASIRAARFAPGLSNTERITLLRDAAERLRKNGQRLRDVKSLLDIKER